MNSAVCLLERAAEKFGGRTAFEDGTLSVSFEELRRLSRRLAAGLLSKTSTGGMCPVIVYLPKSVKSIIGFMGIMYAASPYVPIDYAIPAARLEKTIENLKPSAVITDEQGAENLRKIGVTTDVLLFDGLASSAETAMISGSL